VKAGLWIWFAVTLVNTIYLGWHYVLDDVAGVIMGAMALVLAAGISGIDLRPGPRRRRTAGPAGARRSEGAGRPAALLVPPPRRSESLPEPAAPDGRDVSTRSGRG
jgi:hypothetical protein